jgi:hypothetical protein
MQEHEGNDEESEVSSTRSRMSSSSSNDEDEGNLITVVGRHTKKKNITGSNMREEKTDDYSNHADERRSVPVEEVEVQEEETTASNERSCSVGEVSREFAEYSRNQGMMEKPEHERKLAMGVAGLMFRYKKFIRTERELDFDEEICKKISKTLGRDGMAERNRREWWELVKHDVRQKINKKRSGASQKIREKFMSK